MRLQGQRLTHLASARAMDVDSRRSTSMTTAASPSMGPTSLTGTHQWMVGGGSPAHQKGHGTHTHTPHADASTGGRENPDAPSRHALHSSER